MIEIEATIYMKDDILTNCVVIHRDEVSIICKTADVDIILSPTPMTKSIKVGQTIIVRADYIKYPIGERAIAISAVMFYFPPSIIVRKVNMSSVNNLALQPLLLEMKEEEKRLADKSASWDTFSSMMYAYATPSKKPEKAEVIDILDLLKKEGTFYVARDNRLELSKPSVCVFKDEVFPDNYQLDIDCPADQVLEAIIIEYTSHLRVIRELTTIYSNEQIINAHRNIWQIINKSKLK
jgi:hypothetical protein